MKNVNNNYENICLGQNTSIYCSQNIASGIKPGSNSKRTDKYAFHCSKSVCWDVK